ncbi:PQQ-binding-like beta-propeller repeat protein [Haloarchaeobius sp. DFWS5]|uniref:outer membrane protein assembly factor BamB family protein n=1 Tax=Haloarchaeobius sp. DFWS5 TaxID=3446114 RepID=UPI003EB9CB46
MRRRAFLGSTVGFGAAGCLRLNSSDGTTTDGNAAVPSETSGGTDQEAVTDTETAAAEAGPTTANWRMLQADAANTGHHPGTTGPKDDVKVSWALPGGQGASSWLTPAIVNGTVFTAKRGTQLFAVDYADGEVHWKRPFEGHLVSSPAIEDGRLFVGDTEGYLYAIDPADGTTVWQSNSLDGHPTSPVPLVNSVYTGLDDKLVSLSMDTGGVEWETELPGRVWAPAATPGRVFATATDGGRLYSLDAATGDVEWEYTTHTRVLEPPCVAGDLVYFAGRDGVCHAIDRTEGTEVWRYETGGGDRFTYSDGSQREGTSSLAVADETLYLTHRLDGVHALDAATGEVQWTAETDAAVTVAPVVVDGVVYLADANGNVTAVEVDGGSTLFTAEAGSNRPVFPPAVVDGRLFVGVGDFVALEPR